MRGKLVVETMSRQEGNRDFVVLEDVNRCRRVSPRSQRVDCCNWYVTFELLKTSSADHGNAYRVFNMSVSVHMRRYKCSRSKVVGRSAILNISLSF